MSISRTCNTLLTTTTALSMALASLAPLPALAQDASPPPIPPAEGTAETPANGTPSGDDASATEPAAAEEAPSPTEEIPPEDVPAAAPDEAEQQEPVAEEAPEPPAPGEAPAATAEEPAPSEQPTEAAPEPTDAPATEEVTPEVAAEPEAAQQQNDSAPADEAAAPEEAADPAPSDEPATAEGTPTAAPTAAPADEPAATDDATNDATDPAPAAPTAEGQPASEEQPTPEEQPAEEADATDTEAATPDAEEGATANDTEGQPEPEKEAVDTLNELLNEDASAGAVAAASDGEVTSETSTQITEEDARSSTEDFETTASGERRNDDDDDSGLSNLEKAGLVALGGLVVGALMNNGNEVVANTGDRVVVRQDDGQYVVLKDDDALLRQPGSTVRTETYSDGSTRSTVEYSDGSRVVTLRDATGRVLQRIRVDASGSETRIIDDTGQVAPVDLSLLPRTREDVRVAAGDRDALREALTRIENRENARGYSLSQIRNYPQVRSIAPVVDVENITFRTGSAAIDPAQAEQLSELGNQLKDLLADRPTEVFLIEGHTDAVGSDVSNLALSDRRAESVALALAEYYDIPPENMVVQGYGESDLRIDTEGDEPRNRRVAVRIITPILQTAQAR
ncbi:OmpA family protein [Falsirhodobacter deserti]|uniref:OmpA family protein n=1 Tax=Falsirhodobacter deserti TaxID=1365611 RepID=UPI001F4D7726|nr:OmpA family protein [Falsirhodobacter deserti]